MEDLQYARDESFINIDDIENINVSVEEMLKIIKQQKHDKNRSNLNKKSDIKNNFVTINESKHNNNNDYDDEEIKCRECNSPKLYEIEGYYTCNDCGLLNDCIIDSGQEWRFYGNDDNKSDPSRCDIPTNELLPSISAGSLIGFGGKETSVTKRIRNMNYWNSVPYKDSSLLEIFNNITIMSQNAGIPQCIIDEAKIMYKKVTDIKNSRRTKKDVMKASSISLACKLQGYPRSCAEISKIFKLKNNKSLRKSIKLFEEIWNNIISVEKNGANPIKLAKLLKKGSNHNSDEENDDDDSDDDKDSDDDDIFSEEELETDNNNFNIIKNNEKFDSLKYLHRFCSILGLDDKVYNTCTNILKIVEINKYLEKHNPLSRTSSVIYYVIEKMNINVNKMHIIQTCNISDVTINKCYQKILKYKDQFEKYF